MLAAGTQQVWVVRLVGPQRVEVHRPNQPMQIIIDAILTLLRGRGLMVDAAVEERLRACHDRAALQGWLLNAARVEQAERTFEN